MRRAAEAAVRDQRHTLREPFTDDSPGHSQHLAHARTAARLDHNPLWDHAAECAFPCATQNEINGSDAASLLKNGVYLVAEGANMPSTPEAISHYLEHRILYAPGKAANAGGVAVSGLEMTQNSQRLTWSRDEVDTRLRRIMKNIHQTCVDAARRFDVPGSYLHGANIAGFLKVADAMMDQGLV